MPQLFDELKRRNVFRVGVTYTVIAWVIAQVFDLVVDNFGAPDWVMKVMLTILIAGLPVALVLAWAFELTPEGVKKTADVPVSQSVTPRTGQTLNRITTIALILVLAFVAWDKLGPDSAPQENVVVEKSVAVLPFADLSQTQDQEWFADGLTEEILNALARLPELKVTARTSSFEFKNTNMDIGDIAQRLGVAHVVEGSVRRIGDDLRVTAQLIRAEDGFHLWSKTYQGNTDSLFEVQNDVAASIAATLNVILDEDKRARLFASGTRDVAAFETFLQARNLFARAHRREEGNPATLAAANRFFEMAIEQDPGFSTAAILHSDRYAHFLLEGPIGIVGDAGELDYDSAYAQLQQDFDFAARAAPDDARRIIVELNREFFSNHWHRLPVLIKQFRSELGEDGTIEDDGLWLDEILRFSGDLDLAWRLAEQRREADPLNQVAWMDSINLLIGRGAYDEALAMIDEGRRTAGEGIRFVETDIQAYWLSGNNAAAIETLERNSENSDIADYFPVLLAALQGDMEMATELADAIEMASAHPAYRLIWPYYVMGDSERQSDLVRRIDAMPVGASMLALEIGNNAGMLMFDLENAPNFRKRLEEAQIDPASFASPPPRMD